MIKITERQAEKVKELIHRECCNCVDGNCILLGHECVQLNSLYHIYCKYFLRAVLPIDKKLNEELRRTNNERRQE